MFIFFINQAVSPIFYMGLKAVLSNSLLFSNCSRHVYHQVQLSCVACQDLSHLANTMANINSLLVLDFSHLINTLTNIDDIPKVYFCYLANILASINDIPKVDPCHLTNILTNTNDKVDNFIREEV